MQCNKLTNKEILQSLNKNYINTLSDYLSLLINSIEIILYKYLIIIILFKNIDING
jgi:hypothetical protein